jgi:glycosyltransferase involved in cell wall biosynthesis
MDRLGILHLTTFLQGGAGRAIADLACAQHAAGHRVVVVTSETGRGEFGNYPEYLARLRQAGVTLLKRDSLFSRDRVLHAQVLDMLRRAVQWDAIDLVHAHAAVPASVGMEIASEQSRHIPVIQTQHGWGTNKTREQAAFDIDVLRRVDGVITTSRATADLLVTFGVPSGSINVVPCAVPADVMAPPPEAAGMLAGLRARGLHVAACIGSVTANKNQRLVVEALGLLAGAPIGAAFIGEGSETLMDRAHALGVADRIVSCGYQRNAAAWLPLVDLLIVPSRTEGQGLVVLEAFRAGVPVLASRIAALEELIDDGTSGLLFDADDAESLAEGIRSALALAADERNALTGQGRLRVARDFSMEKMLSRHEALYRRVARGAVLKSVDK